MMDGQRLGTLFVFYKDLQNFPELYVFDNTCIPIRDMSRVKSTVLLMA